MARGRTGTAVATVAGGPHVVEATGAYSAAQTNKAKRPVPRTRRGSPADGAAATGDSGETGVGRKRQRTQPWETEYQKIWKTVTDLGAEQFTGRDKKEYEARKIVERGGRAPKEARMPYVMLQGLRKKATQRHERREAVEAEAGVITGNAGSARRKSAQTSRGRSGGGASNRGGSSGSAYGSRAATNRGSSSSFGPAPSMGMMKSGVLHVSKNTAPPGVRKRMSEGSRGGGRGGKGGNSRGSGGRGRGRG